MEKNSNHSHCKECAGMIEPEFDYCLEHCPTIGADFGFITHSIVATPGALDPSGQCGHCGYPRANISFYRYRILFCPNDQCPDYKQYKAGIFHYQPVLRGRRYEEALPKCDSLVGGCCETLVVVRVVDDIVAQIRAFKDEHPFSPEDRILIFKH